MKPQNGKMGWMKVVRDVGLCVALITILTSQDKEKTLRNSGLLVCNCANYTVIKAEVAGT